jgi:RNA polymerase sigma factor (sigma-70 family)
MSQELILRAKFGDRAAMLELWEKYYRLGLHVIPKRMRDGAELGVVWEALLAAVSKFDMQFGMPGFRGYFTKASKNLAVKAWKADTLIAKPSHWAKAEYEWTSDGVYETAEDWSQTPEKLIDSAKGDLAAIGSSAYARLPDRARRVIEILVEGGTQLEAAQEFGLTHQAVSLMMAKAISDLENPRKCEICGRRLGACKQKYCSQECSDVSYLSQRQRQKIEGRKCGFCGHELTGRSRSFCNVQCRRLDGLRKAMVRS